MWNCGVSRKMSALRPIFLSLVLASGGYGFPSGNICSFPAESSSPDAIATVISLSNRVVELNSTAEHSDAGASASGAQSGPHRPHQLQHQQHGCPASLAASASRIVPLAAPNWGPQLSRIEGPDNSLGRVTPVQKCHLGGVNYDALLNI